MTREEFKELCSLRDREYLENLLYDIKFNRTCENCKFQKNKKGHLDCVIAIQTTHRPEFYCCSWEKK